MKSCSPAGWRWRILRFCLPDQSPDKDRTIAAVMVGLIPMDAGVFRPQRLERYTLAFQTPGGWRHNPVPPIVGVVCVRGRKRTVPLFLIPQECIHLVQGSPDTSTIQWRGAGVGHLQITLAIGRQ